MEEPLIWTRPPATFWAVNCHLDSCQNGTSLFPVFKLIKAVLAGSEVLEDLEKCQREVRNLRMDFDDFFERFNRLQGRLAKRGELKPTPDAPPGEATPEVVNERHAQLDAEIFRRRRAIQG